MGIETSYLQAAVWAAGLSHFNYLEAEQQPKNGQCVKQALLSQWGWDVSGRLPADLLLD